MGLFVGESISPFSFLCCYEGYKRESFELESLDSSILMKKLEYLFTIPSIQEKDKIWILDPTSDESGSLLSKYRISYDCISDEDLQKLLMDFGGLYINEPGMDQVPNCCFVYNESFDKVEIWSIKNIKKDEELLLFYGAGFDRFYLLSQYLYNITNLCIILKNQGNDVIIKINDISLSYSIHGKLGLQELLSELPDECTMILCELLPLLNSKIQDNGGWNIKWESQ